jgi:predicted RNA-binding Zn-ribbon protein involved in translation (DUF1610 family)
VADEVSALEKHACPACGAQAEWNPTKQKLVCPFCGTESPYKIDRDIGKVAERDLSGGLTDDAAAAKTFHEQRRSVQCQSCKAIMVYEADRVGQYCEFCGSPALVAYEEIKSPIRPEGVLPFKVDRNRVRDDIRRWWRSKWLAPGRLAKTALVDTVKSLYIPYWTFDARAHCPWEAEAGHYYYVNVEGRDSKGNRVVRQERRVRWEPASGVIDHTFDDELVPGTTGVNQNLLRQVEPFPTGECVPYDTAFLSGHVVEHYQVALTEASGESEAQMHAKLEALCAQQIPGDTYRNLVIHPSFSSRTFKHLLVPIWLLVYMFGSRSYQVVVNGYTGRIAGKYPYSPWKIAFLIVLAIIVFVLFVIANENS